MKTNRGMKKVLWEDPDELQIDFLSFVINCFYWPNRLKCFPIVFKRRTRSCIHFREGPE